MSNEQELELLRRKRPNRSKGMIYRREKKEILIEYKGGKCQKCGYDKCPDALQFHHIDANTKVIEIGGFRHTLDKLKAEADKCTLLCSNCHIEQHIIESHDRKDHESFYGKDLEAIRVAIKKSNSTRNLNLS